MRGMFSKRDGMKNCRATKFNNRGISEASLKMVFTCPPAVEGNGNQNCSLLKTRNYEAMLLEESATKLVNL